MPVAVIMPRLGLTMEDGTVAAWRLQPGDPVAPGQVMLEVETDKVVVEVEAQAAGVLGPALVDAGRRVPVGTVLAHIFAVGEPRITPVETPTPSAEAAATPIPEQAAPGWTMPGKAPREPAQRRFSSPRARRRARAEGIAWQAIAGTGPAGRVVERDVLREAARRKEVSPTAAAGAPPAWVISTEVSVAALLAIQPSLATLLAAETGHRLAIVDWIVLAVTRTLAASLGAGVVLVDAERGTNDLWRPGQTLPSLRQALNQRCEPGSARNAGPHGSLDAPGAVVAMVDASGHTRGSLHIAPVPPQVAVLTVGRVDPEKQTVWMALAGDTSGLSWAVAASRFEEMAEMLGDPLVFLT